MTAWVIPIGAAFPDHWTIARDHGAWDITRRAAIDTSDDVNFSARWRDCFAWVSRTYLIGFLPEVSLPALLCEAGRRGAYLDMVTPGALPDGYAADNGGALLWLGGRRRRGERTARRTGVSRDASGGQNRGDPAGRALPGVNAQVGGGARGPPNRTGTPSVTSTLSGGPDGWGRPVAATSSSFSSSTRASRSVHARWALGR